MNSNPGTPAQTPHRNGRPPGLSCQPPQHAREVIGSFGSTFTSDRRGGTAKVGNAVNRKSSKFNCDHAAITKFSARLRCIHHLPPPMLDQGYSFSMSLRIAAKTSGVLSGIPRLTTSRSVRRVSSSSAARWPISTRNGLIDDGRRPEKVDAGQARLGYAGCQSCDKPVRRCLGREVGMASRMALEFTSVRLLHLQAVEIGVLRSARE